MMKLLKRILRKNQWTEKERISENTTYIDPQEMWYINIALASGDYGWRHVNHKRVLLTNPKDCEYLSLSTVASAFRGLGHYEWEAILAFWLLKAANESMKMHLETADITPMFSVDFLSRNKECTQEEVEEKIMNVFEIVSENEKCMEVKVRTA